MNTETEEMPAELRDLVGTKKLIRGGVFSRKKSIPEAEFDVLDIRWSAHVIMNIDSEKRYPAFELLVKNKEMNRARWTRPFPYKKIELED